jgi:hypothetical protein
VDQWRAIGNQSSLGVTPETARPLQHWRHHEFTGVRPFFCQTEAAETAIWLTEVAPNEAQSKRFLEHLANANNDAKIVITNYSRVEAPRTAGAGQARSTRCSPASARHLCLRFLLDRFLHMQWPRSGSAPRSQAERRTKTRQ